MRKYAKLFKTDSYNFSKDESDDTSEDKFLGLCPKQNFIKTNGIYSHNFSKNVSGITPEVKK